VKNFRKCKREGEEENRGGPYENIKRDDSIMRGSEADSTDQSLYTLSVGVGYGNEYRRKTNCNKAKSAAEVGRE